MPMPMMNENEGPAETTDEKGVEETCACPKCGFKGPMEQFMGQEQPPMPKGAPDAEMMNLVKGMK